MAAKDSSITLPWLWVIEALASCEQVDISLLNDLIKRAPEFPDNVGKNTREMIALRCLEGVFGPSNEITNDIPSALDLKIGFNSSESCEDVLQRILREMSISNLRMAGPELLKWDVRPFIMHKRTCLPKCALEQLKDGILEGTHPSAAFLSQRSGLAIRNECDDRNPVDDGDPNATLSRFDGSGTDHQIKAASRKSIALIPENGNGPLQEDSSNRILLPSKRGRSDLADENLAGQSHELSMENGGDLHLNAKKFKQGSSSTSQSVGQDLVPLHRNEQLEDSSGRTIPDTEREGVDLAKESQVGGLEGSIVSEDVHDDNVSSKSFEQSSDVNDDKVQHNQLQSRNNNKLPQDTSGDGPYQNISVDGNKGDIECCVEPKASNAATPNGIQQEISIDAAKDDAEASFRRKTPNGVSPDGSKGKRIASEAEDDMEHDGAEETSSESDGYHKEKIDVTTKKHCFLSSQSIFSQDSLSTADWTEQNLCMKCNKDGQLLVCSASGCPLVVHESCLGSSASFDNKGNFYCPFCAYSLSISEYLEAKKKASLARKELGAFIGMEIKHQRKKRSKRFLHKKEKSELRQNEDVNLHVKSHGNGSLREEEDGQADHNGEHVNQVGEEQDRQAEPNGELVNQVDNHQIRESVDGKQQAEHSVPCVNDNLLCREEDATAFGGAVGVLTEEKQGGGKIDEERPSVKGLEGQQNQIPAGGDCDDDNSCFRDRETILVSWRPAEVGIQQDDLQQVTDPHQEPACEPNNDVLETSEDENDKAVVSNYSIRFRNQEKRYTYPAIPLLRRKKVAWTTEEEEMLKEGVQRLSSAGERNIPWKKILEFGGNVFQKGRTPIDLKDKWRNICKGSPKSK